MMRSLRLCTASWQRQGPVSRLPRRCPRVVRIHAAKPRDYFGYYSSDEAAELSQMMPSDPNSLFDDSALPAGADLGLYGTAAATAAGSATAANRLFGGDLHSSLDESLYSDSYSEDFNSFRDPGPDAGPWFSQTSPLNSGHSLDEDVELLSDEAKAYRDWELEKAMSEALAMSSYQLENTANRYAISVEHAAFMEDIEVEDAASGLEASPLAATMLPPWMRAVQRVQEEFDMLNEQQMWREEEASIAAIERFEREIREQVEQNLRIYTAKRPDEIDWDAPVVSPPMLLEEPPEEGLLLAEPGQEPQALDALFPSMLDGVDGVDVDDDHDLAYALGEEAVGVANPLDSFMGGQGLGAGSEAVWGASAPAEFEGLPAVSSAWSEGLPDLLPLDFLPGAELAIGMPAAGGAAVGGGYSDPMLSMLSPPGFGGEGAGAGGGSTRRRDRAAAGAAAAATALVGAAEGDAALLTPQQALEDMDAEFERREAGWDDLSAGDDVWGAGAAAQRGAAAAGPGFVNELERYSGQYGGALDDELGSWWQEGDDLSEGEDGFDPSQFDAAALGLPSEGESEGEEGLEDDEDDDAFFSKNDLFRLRQVEEELLRRQQFDNLE